MDFPEDLCFEVASYLPAIQLLSFRAASKAMQEYAKGFKGDYLRIRSLKKWHACFPRATKANVTGYPFCEDDMPYLATVQELDMSLCSPYVKSISFNSLAGIKWFHLPGLKKLTIQNSVHMTDDWLELFTELEELSIGYCSNIDGSGFRAMRHLKSLILFSMKHITDDAFVDLPIQDLRIVDNSRITDKGIRQLKQLTHLYVSFVKRVKGHGFDVLPLKEVHLSNIKVDHGVFWSFMKVPVLSFGSCHFVCSSYQLWKNLTHLTIYDSRFKDLNNLIKLLELHDFKKLQLVRCTYSPYPFQHKVGEELIEKLRLKQIPS